MLAFLIASSIALAVYSLTLLFIGNSPKEQIKKRLDKLAENVELEYIHDAVLNEKKKKRKEKKRRCSSANLLKNISLLPGSGSARRNT